MREEDRDFDGRAFGLGLLLGAAVGAGAALLMAPESGQKTRRRLRRGAERLYSDGGERLGRLYSGGGERLGRLYSGGEERLASLWEEADASARRLRRALQRKARSSISAVRR